MNNQFIRVLTQEQCQGFAEFQRVAKEYQLYFERVNGEMILCYAGKGEADKACYDFYRHFYPETKLQAKDFNLVKKIREMYEGFVFQEVNQCYQRYNLPPRYDRSLSIRENAVLLLNTLKLKTALRKEDVDFIQELLRY